MITRREQRLLAFALASLVGSTGCVSVFSGYSVTGVPISQRERDRASFPVFYAWQEVPDPPPEHWNPGVLLVNAGASLVLDVGLVGIFAAFGWLDDDTSEERRLRDELDEQAEARKRGEKSAPAVEPGVLRNPDGSFRPVQPPALR